MIPSTHWRLLDQPGPYADLKLVLHELVTRVRHILAGRFVGAYLQGSFAVGDFDIHSDVDFLIVVDEDIPDSLVPALQTLHGEVFAMRSAWARHLEGSYIPRHALRHFPPPTRKFLYLDNGSRELIRSDHDDSLVVYWVLRERGVTLIGPAPPSLVAPVSPDALRQEVLETMPTWEQQLLANRNKVNNRFYQALVVLSYCRMLQTLQLGTIESKPAAAAWAEQALDSHWIPLIWRAWNDRAEDAAVKVRQKADPDDLERTWEFIRYAVELGRRWRASRSA